MEDPELYKRLNAITYQLGLLDRKVSFLFQHLGVEFVDTRAPADEFEQMILAGDRIGAIRHYQTRRGVGLLDAKRAIEEMAARLGL